MIRHFTLLNDFGTQVFSQVVVALYPGLLAIYNVPVCINRSEVKRWAIVRLCQYYSVFKANEGAWVFKKLGELTNLFG